MVVTGQVDVHLFWQDIQRSQSQGIEVKDRGRVSAELMAKFKIATDQ